MKSRDGKIDALAEAIYAEHDALVQRLRDAITALPCVPAMQIAALMSLAELAAMVIVSLEQNVNATTDWLELFGERIIQRMEAYADDDAKEG